MSLDGLTPLDRRDYGEDRNQECQICPGAVPAAAKLKQKNRAKEKLTGQRKGEHLQRLEVLKLGVHTLARC